MDIYLQRIRKYQATLPETVLTPAISGDTGVSSPRMGTPQNDTSWAGWAISSFTNKVASARGDIQPRMGIDRTSSERGEGPSSSIVPGMNTVRSSSNGASTPSLDSKVLDSAASPPTTSTTPAANYFEDPSVADEGVDAWAAMEDFENPPEPKQAAKTTDAFVGYADAGQPDFAGWLAAQAQSKSKKPLPKGLTKKSEKSSLKKPVASEKVPVIGGMESRLVGGLERTTSSSRPTNTTGSAPPAAKPTLKSTSSITKVDTKPKDDDWGEDDGGWGAGWE